MENGKEKSQQPYRIFCDGCYDIYHYGHANQFLQAKQMGSYLIAGIHPDKVIMANKGPPVIKEDERYRLIRSVRFVDDVMEGIGYDITPAMLDAAGCDICVHGDDVVITNAGNDAYAAIRKQNRYKTCRRTSGISTTDLVGRMLLLTKDHHSKTCVLSPDHMEIAQHLALDHTGFKPWVTVRQYHPGTDTLSVLVPGRPKDAKTRAVYIDGNFDLFHIGHLLFLEKAAKRYDYVIVGVHTDAAVNDYKGHNYPIMSFHERILTVLACRYVDELVIGAPYGITHGLLQAFDGVKVLHGRTDITPDPKGHDPYELPRQQGIFEVMDSGSDMSSAKIAQRIIENRLEYEIRNNKSHEKERAALEATLKKFSEARKLSETKRYA